MSCSRRTCSWMSSLRWVAILALSAVIIPACGGGKGGSAAPPTGSVEGTVVGSPTPVQGVKITVDDNPAWSATTSSEGYFKIVGVPPGSHSVAMDGSVVFDSLGNRLPPKADLHLGGVQFISGTTIQLATRPLFIPTLDKGVQVAATPFGNGTATYTFPADQRIGNDALRCYLDLTAGTRVTLLDPTKTTLSVS